MTSADEADLARALVLLAADLEAVPKRLRAFAAGNIIGWATDEQADGMASVLDDLGEMLQEAARQIRLSRAREIEPAS